MTDQQSQTDGKLILLDRLCSAFGREMTKKQIDEWLSIMDKVRADDAIIAVQSLIETSNRFPTIAEFRTASMQAYTVRINAVKEMTDVSPIVRKVEADAMKEAFGWWRDRFGSYAPNMRALIGHTCSMAEKPWKASALFAATICELENEPDYKVRYNRMAEVAQSIATKSNPTAQPMPEDIIGF